MNNQQPQPHQVQSQHNLPARSNSRPVVEVKAVTWDKDSHGLFDYENSYYDMRKFQIARSVKIGRHSDEIHCWSQNQKLEPKMNESTEYLLTISQKRESRETFEVDVPGKFANNEKATDRKSYLIVRSLKCTDGRNQRGFELQPGQVIKLGRVEYRVREFKIQTENGFVVKSIEEENYMAHLPNEEMFDATEQALEHAKNKELQCRYCFQNTISEDEMDNLLINPCACKNEDNLVHLVCLMNWIQYKIISKTTSNIATYQWKKLQCEVCTSNWPMNIKYKENIKSLISVERPDFPYIIFEKQTNEDNTILRTNSLSLIVPTDANPIKLGRGHQCDLRISDISVSRVHAFLKFENNRFLIYDNDSKFGTLVQLNSPYPVKRDKAAIQIGRTVFTFVLKYSKTGSKVYGKKPEERKTLPDSTKTKKM